MKKILKIGGIGFIVLIVLVAIGSGMSGSKKVGQNQVGTSNTTTSQATTQEQQEPIQQIYRVGDKIQLGDVILTINNVELSQGAQYSKPQEGNQWIEINMTLENTGSSQQYITTLGQMFVLDGANNQYQSTVTGRRLANPGSMGMDGALIAKAKKTDWVGFEVPKTATGLKFQFNASFWNNKSILVDLGM